MQRAPYSSPVSPVNGGSTIEHIRVTCIYNDTSDRLWQGDEYRMRQRTCPRHGAQHPCTCAMGNLYRFVEPVLLFLLKRKSRCYGYELVGDLHEYALTDSEIEIAAVYRTLRQLEKNGCVNSEWDIEGSGPARRLYVLTPHGEQHFQEWITVLEHVCKSMERFVREAQMVTGGAHACTTRNGRRSAIAARQPA
jgi:PadR family transcriptional regulator, regulatory protein PadR